MKIVDLFCGCGGMSLGFSNAGFDVIAGFENWDSAYSCYNANFNNRAIKMDLANVSLVIAKLKEIKPDIIIGGPPCQDFSLAGEQVEGDRANLTYSFAEIVVGYKPAFFVMENVQQVIDSEVYAKAKKLFVENGYGLTEKVLDASFCGVPQKRKRFFCIGGLNKDCDFLSVALSGPQTVFPLTLREYLESTNQEFGIDYYYRHPRTYGRRAIFSIDEPSPTIRGVNRPKPSQYQKHDNDPVDPANVRALTYLERACIQTFPPNFTWDRTLSVSEQMIGNAVPVNLANYVAVALKNYIYGKIDTNSICFVDWLIKQKKISPKAAGDVLSRANRARKIKKFSNYKYINYINELEKNVDFLKLKNSTQSEIRRAVKLYFEYKETRRNQNG
jgi:DNA (cytosine-5)-methyltransferase 1